MARVAVLDDWQGIAETSTDWSALRTRAEVVFFRDAFPDAEALCHGVAGFDVVIAMRERSRFPAELIARLSDLRLLVFTGVVNRAVDVAACTAQRILVCNTSAHPSNGTAEMTLGLMIAVARRIPLADAEMRAGRFQADVPPGMELCGRVLGLVGLGSIGAMMARYGVALGMEVIAWSQNLTAARAIEAGATRVAKEALFARADVVSLHVVLSDRSRGMVGAAEIAHMKPNAILLNTSRAGLIDQDALIAALRQGKIFAGLDVYDHEPLAADHPLRSVPNTVLTPHLGYVCADTMALLYRECAGNVIAWLDGRPIRMVNPDVFTNS